MKSDQPASDSASPPTRFQVGAVSGAASFHDHRDRGNPLVKVPDPRSWENWQHRTEFDQRSR